MTIYNKPSIRKLSPAEERLSDLLEWAFDELWYYWFHRGVPLNLEDITIRVYGYPNGKIAPITIIEIAAKMAMHDYTSIVWCIEETIERFCLEDGE